MSCLVLGAPDAVLDSAIGSNAHLLTHATEGYFVPVEMPSGPLFDGKVGWLKAGGGASVLEPRVGARGVQELPRAYALASCVRPGLVCTPCLVS